LAIFHRVKRPSKIHRNYPCDLYPEWRIWLDNFATTEEIPSCGMMFARVAYEKIFCICVQKRVFSFWRTSTFAVLFK
jgi:hypothetical protein